MASQLVDANVIMTGIKNYVYHDDGRYRPLSMAMRELVVRDDLANIPEALVVKTESHDVYGTAKRMIQMIGVCVEGGNRYMIDIIMGAKPRDEYDPAEQTKIRNLLERCLAGSDPGVFSPVAIALWKGYVKPLDDNGDAFLNENRNNRAYAPIYNTRRRELDEKSEMWGRMVQKLLEYVYRSKITGHHLLLYTVYATVDIHGRSAPLIYHVLKIIAAMIPIFQDDPVKYKGEYRNNKSVAIYAGVQPWLVVLELLCDPDRNVSTGRSTRTHAQIVGSTTETAYTVYDNMPTSEIKARVGIILKPCISYNYNTGSGTFRADLVAPVVATSV